MVRLRYSVSACPIGVIANYATIDFLLHTSPKTKMVGALITINKVQAHMAVIRVNG